MKKNLILLIIAMALGAYVYFVEIKGGEEKQKAKERAEKVFNVSRDSVAQVEIQSYRGNFVFTRGEDGWQIEKPVQTQADQSSVNSLLSSLTSARKSSTFHIDPQDRLSYGFGPMQIRIIATMKDGARDTLYLGNKSEVGSEVYATRVDTIVYLISSSLKSSADKSLFDWRDKKAIHFSKEDVREISLRNEHGSFQFVKEGNEWNLTKPVATRAEKLKVSDILNKLLNSNIKAVADEQADNAAKYGLNKPAYRIDLLLGADKTRAGISFSGLKDNKSYGKDDARKHIFEVDSTFLKPMRADLFKFRDKKIFEFDQDKADRVNLLYQGELTTVVKDTADNWSLAGGEKARNWKVTSLLRKIANLEADRFVEENPTYFMNYGLVNPEGKIEVFNGNDKLAELNIGFKRNKQVYVFNPDAKPLMAVDESDIKELFPKKSEIIDESAVTATTTGDSAK